MNYPDAFVLWVLLCVRTFDDILFNGESDGEWKNSQTPPPPSPFTPVDDE